MDPLAEVRFAARVMQSLKSTILVNQYFYQFAAVATVMLSNIIGGA